MEKSLAIANAIIQRALEAKRPPTQMKLQKLIYFAHGWNLALFDVPLVDEEFQAWPYGPVLPSVYHEFKSFGTLGIDEYATKLVKLPTGGFNWVPYSIQFDSTISDLLNKIWEVFGKYSGTQLSSMTHQINSPWKKIHDQYGDTRDVPIPNFMIKEYFKSLITNE